MTQHDNRTFREIMTSFKSENRFAENRKGISNSMINNSLRDEQVNSIFFLT